MKTRALLTQEDCVKILAGAEAEARRNGWIVAVAIVDDGGHLLQFSRMDGATPANAAIAVEKGRTAAISRRPTKHWEDRIAAGRTVLMNMPGILPVQGGLPIVIDGHCIGAVGVSGVQSHEDEQICEAGIKALG